jgi:glutamate dehydrogenase/leucine dehydrogenase
MADKCAAARVPLDGQKTLVICPDGVPMTAGEKAALLADHIARVSASDRRGIFGPDMACGNDVLDLLANDPVVGGHVTGLSEANFGLDINAHAFTARGVVHALDCITSDGVASVGSATVQGFGMVGAPIALALWHRGIVVRAVSNVTGTLVNNVGLDLPRLFALWRELGDESLAAFGSTDACATFVADPGALFSVRAELFVPAARTTVLALADELDGCRHENRDVRAVEEFLERAECDAVLEAANHPLTPAAEAYLERRGVTILPDVLVNVGGMVGCYAEWRYRPRVRSGALSIPDLADRCHAFTARSIEANMHRLTTRSGLAREAAQAIVAANRAEMLAERPSWNIFQLDQ